ncbi:membrane protein [Clavibacter michiganensis]|uniref:membrane protein n=1 Tax=Clavibacter michiganensis TaxID=28447 RepID=UPI0005BBD8E7|nr:membrane protein [Clavibacter michiganensis]
MTDPAAPAPDDQPAAPAHAAPPVPPHASASAPAAAPYGLAPAPVPPAPAAVAWGQPVYAAAPPKGMSLTSMILGLVSLFFFWTLLCPLIGLVFGIVGFRREPAGRGFAITGLVLNGLLLLIPVAVVLSIVVAGGTLFSIAATTPR